MFAVGLVSSCPKRHPDTGACHALVKRMVHESQGLVAPLAGSQIQLHRIDPPIILDIAPTSADDGVIERHEPEVLRAIQHIKRVMPLVGFRFSTMQVVAAAAGTRDPERFRAFRDEGCIAALDGNFEVLKSPIGDDTFCEAFCSRVAAKQGKVLEFLSELGDPQVTHFLTKWCINGSRTNNYLARTTPPEFRQTAAYDFDKGCC